MGVSTALGITACGTKNLISALAISDLLMVYAATSICAQHISTERSSVPRHHSRSLTKFLCATPTRIVNYEHSILLATSATITADGPNPFCLPTTSRPSSRLVCSGEHKLVRQTNNQPSIIHHIRPLGLATYVYTIIRTNTNLDTLLWSATALCVLDSTASAFSLLNI